MSFLAPDRLLLLALPLIGALAYVVTMRRQRKYAVRFTNLELLDSVAPNRPGWRRHVTALVLLIAVASLVLAFARPLMAVQVPREQAALILAIDVSLSMDADDVGPNRLEAAQAAAFDFIELAPDDLRIGIVPFASVALPAVPPTVDRAAAHAAVARLSLAEGTAIGEAIYTSLDLAAGEVTEDGESIPAAIVVLSDGETTVGRSEIDAADEALTEGIPVSTVSFGTRTGTIVYQGEVVAVPANEGALRQVADTTGGRFFTAVSAEELGQVFDDVGSEVGFATEQREVSEWFLGAGLLILVLAAAGSLLWFSRLP